MDLVTYYAVRNAVHLDDGDQLELSLIAPGIMTWPVPEPKPEPKPEPPKPHVFHEDVTIEGWRKRIARTWVRLLP